MSAFEQLLVPKKYRNRFTAAVAARRALIEATAKAHNKGLDAPATAVNRDYRAMNALPLHWQIIAAKRAQK